MCDKETVARLEADVARERAGFEARVHEVLRRGSARRWASFAQRRRGVSQIAREFAKALARKLIRGDGHV